MVPTMTYAAFVSCYAANRRKIPTALALPIVREALARIEARAKAGRWGDMLSFADLVERMERAAANGVLRPIPQNAD